MVTVSEREFFIWKLEWWWVFLDKPEFYPKDRLHLTGKLFWRKNEKN